jgi:FKBP-type peptidyl-prolyl cis-trans isomerase FkpA
MKKLIYLFAFSAILFNVRCSKEDQAVSDDKTIQEYIKKNNITAIKHSSGLYYVIKTEGTGPNPTLASKVTVHYKGYLTNGNQFDGTTTTPISFQLSGLIAGWQIGIPLIKKGGDIKLILPSALAYGPSGSGSIGPNEVLIFDIQLISF